MQNTAFRVKTGLVGNSSGPALRRLPAATGFLKSSSTSPRRSTTTTALRSFGSTYDDDGNPVFGRHEASRFVPERYVRITETARPPLFRVAAQGYVPPAGSVHLSGHGRGVLHRDGVHVMIEAPSDEIVLTVARALEPAPER